MIQTAEKFFMQDISHRRLGLELRALIDTLRDPLSPARRPVEYANAYRDLMVLVSNERYWQMIFNVQPGCNSNYIMTLLKGFRLDWLRQFRAAELQKSGERR